jgi:hypothetical protein
MIVISLAAGQIEGVFRTAGPIGRATDGTPCFILLRFYKDGLVLYASLCKDVEAQWNEVEKYFNRDAATADVLLSTGLGQYKMEGSHIQFSTRQYDRNSDMLVELEHSGEVIGDHLWIRTTFAGHPFAGGHEFVPLRAAQG